MNTEDADQLGVEDGARVELEAGGRTLELPVRLSDGLARGTAGVAAGLPGLPEPAAKRGRIRRAKP